MNQAQMVLQYLRKHGSITVLEAEKPPILCKRLASRVDDIHNGRGVEQAQTRQEMITVPSGKRVAKYYLVRADPELDAKIKEVEDILYSYPTNCPERKKIETQLEKLYLKRRA